MEQMQTRKVATTQTLLDQAKQTRTFLVGAMGVMEELRGILAEPDSKQRQDRLHVCLGGLRQMSEEIGLQDIGTVAKETAFLVHAHIRHDSAVSPQVQSVLAGSLECLQILIENVEAVVNRGGELATPQYVKTHLTTLRGLLMTRLLKGKMKRDEDNESVRVPSIQSVVHRPQVMGLDQVKGKLSELMEIQKNLMESTKFMDALKREQKGQIIQVYQGLSGLVAELND